MSKFIPMISSGAAGPLGVLHLPRLWLKVSLDSTGQLNDEYPAVGAGFDQMVLDGLGIDKEEFLSYMNENKPSYCQMESWILRQKGGSLDQNAVQVLNDSIVGYNHDDDTRAGICDLAGRSDDGSVKDAVNLNNLEDWAEFHKENIA